VSPVARRRLIQDGCLDPQCGTWPRRAGSDPGPGHSAYHRGLLPTGQPADLLDHAPRSDRGVLAIKPGHQQYLLLAARFHRGRGTGGFDGRPDLAIGQRDRYHHPRQQHGVVERQNRQLHSFGQDCHPCEED
jgi:hypothetical protein